MTLNWRHKAGLFLTLVAVGCGLFLECSAKQAVGVALIGIAFTWLVGSLTPRTLVVTFEILLCAVGLYVATAPVWSDWNSTQRSVAEYDLAIADLQSAIKGAVVWDPDLSTLRPIEGSSDASKGDPGPGPWEKYSTKSEPKKQGQYTADDIMPTRTVTIPEPGWKWMRSQVLPPLPKGYTLVNPSPQPTISAQRSFPETMSDEEIMQEFKANFLFPRPMFSLGSSVRAHAWPVFGGLSLFQFWPVNLGLVVSSETT